MSIITISPALPAMTEYFSTVENSRFLVQLALTVPALFIAITSPVAGHLIDRYGRLKLLWGALVLYAAAGVSGFFLDSLGAILFSRVLLGVAVGLSMTIVITLVADYFEGQERQKFLGIQVAFMSLGGILFLSAGGVLADIGWRYPFLIYLFSLLVLPLSMIFLQEPVMHRSAKVSDSRLRPPKIFWVLVFNTMIMWILFFIIPVQIPFQLKAIGVDSNALIGIAIASSTASSAVSSFFYSRIKDKINNFRVFTLGYILMAVGFLLVGIAETYTVIMLAMLFSGLGIGMMIPNTNWWIMSIVPPEIRGRSIGKLTTFWFLGQFLSPFIAWPISKILSVNMLFITVGGLMLLLALFFIILKTVSQNNPEFFSSDQSIAS